jgi:hypothetical protein
MKTTRTTIGAAALTCLLVLSGCGDKESAKDVLKTATPSAATDEQGGGRSTAVRAQMEKIQECLKAAGLEDKLPKGGPTDRPTDMPAQPPSGGSAGAPQGGGPGAMQDPEVQKALKACGIDMPERPQQAPSN